MMMFVLIFTTLGIRVELVFITAVMILSQIIYQDFNRSVLLIILFALLSISSTIMIDSYFWGRLIWPEFQVFLFNGVQNRSVEWGVSPFTFYFTNLLPKITPIALPISILGLFYKDTRFWTILSLAHVLLLSNIGHKEWRFIIYCIPMLNISASITASRLMNRSKLIKLGFYFGCIGMFCVSLAMLYISSLNYPGGYALKRFHELVKPYDDCKVHMDTLTTMTGAIRFGELYSCEYSKIENHTKIEFERYDYMLSANPNFSEWKILDSVRGFDGIQLKENRPVIKTKELIYILKRET